MASLEKVDVVIIGAGPCGAMMAAKLAGAGKSVVILEQGPPWKQADMISSDIWSRRLKWSGPTVQASGANPIGHAGNAGWGSGGAGIHHFAQWPRLHPEDFQTFSLYGRGVDWPFSYDDLRPAYDLVQEEVGISGDASKEPWRPPADPYPMPPLKTFRHAELIAETFAKAGIATAPMPLAINSVTYKGRAACLYDGWCNSGCPIGALVDPLATYLPVALKGGTELRNHCWVTRVLTDAAGKRAAGVEYYDANHQRQIQNGALVVLAGNAVQNARLLLNSATATHPDGLANGSGAVGLYFCGHNSCGFNGWFDEELQPWFGVTGGSIYSQAQYRKDSHGNAFGSYTWTMGNARKPANAANVDRTLFGNDLHAFIREGVRHLAGFGVIGEQLPRAENRIVLSDGKDAFGFPLARTVHSADDTDKTLFAYMHDRGMEIMKMSGATRIWASTNIGWQHFLGGTRMGPDPETSVCDGYAMAHEIPNLAIAGTGIFPTEGGTHPTYTAQALTQRTAEHVIREWSSITA